MFLIQSDEIFRQASARLWAFVLILVLCIGLYLYGYEPIHIMSTHTLNIRTMQMWAENKRCFSRFILRAAHFWVARIHIAPMDGSHTSFAGSFFYPQRFLVHIIFSPYWLLSMLPWVSPWSWECDKWAQKCDTLKPFPWISSNNSRESAYLLLCRVRLPYLLDAVSNIVLNNSIHTIW